jgi:hypothetical protein
MSGLTKEERWLVLLVLAMLLTGAVVRSVRRGSGDSAVQDGAPSAADREQSVLSEGQ